MPLKTHARSDRGSFQLSHADTTSANCERLHNILTVKVLRPMDRADVDSALGDGGIAPGNHIKPRISCPFSAVAE